MRGILFFLCILSSVLHAQDVSDPIVHSIFFIGDTGNDTIPSEALFLLSFEAGTQTNRSIVFLGDNVYPSGNSAFDGASAHRERRIMESQLELFSPFRGSVFVVPGNHDWSRGKADGAAAVLRQQHIVNDFTRSNSVNSNAGQTYFPGNAQSGPVQVQPHPAVRLIFLDTQWWLQGNGRRRIPGSSGLSRREQEANCLARLDSMLSRAQEDDALCIVIGHHPVFTNGQHSHRREPLRFLLNYTPLALFRLLGTDRFMGQDIDQPRYRRFRNQLREVFAHYSPMVYVAGHDHNLQVMRDLGNYYVVSGAGSKQHTIDRYRFPARFMEDQQSGFFRMDLHASGNVRIAAYGVRNRGVFWDSWMFQKAIPEMPADTLQAPNIR